MFLIVEPIAGHVVEPLLGAQAGLYLRGRPSANSISPCCCPTMPLRSHRRGCHSRPPPVRSAGLRRLHDDVRELAVASGLSTPARFDEGVQDLLRTAEPDGTFCYTFFRATARA